MASTVIGLCDGYLKCGDNCSRFCVARLSVIAAKVTITIATFGPFSNHIRDPSGYHPMSRFATSTPHPVNSRPLLQLFLSTDCHYWNLTSQTSTKHLVNSCPLQPLFNLFKKNPLFPSTSFQSIFNHFFTTSGQLKHTSTFPIISLPLLQHMWFTSALALGHLHTTSCLLPAASSTFCRYFGALPHHIPTLLKHFSIV